ncbi:single-stranded DNA-binding protein Ssb [Melissococcus plutonius]|uniref:single-stranded DNA-binding protein n=1 Tax=Melissococcus plutonius TaxID=33970 RepID=UPI00065DC0E3|nr:single-stranded DNA-binding protein [Melissococcus plutonius]AIM25020.1 single-stranded DNA-binding protein Ssb [Melissococcus plutonius S1]KMT23464.1 single-stranded DNA-binding protein Ssb [Melissococcus plutonius]KMT25222.1 single-stranded DNA-binding protein Ssb [Melissococcus plutonius]KMT26128.1 single-stranded DNA-binding protein Ssb [Melissococcus plutonius]KMT26858.1 single-stranded DNA-binding protein Ssb [Melissococcus plutonius]
MINNVVLVGRLTKDPDLRYTSGDSAVATFTLAVNRNFKNQNGDREADFVNCVIWRKPAETLANYACKGTLLGVVGRIQSRSYENQQGQRVYVTEVVCDNFQLLESKNTRESQNKQDRDNLNKNESNYIQEQNNVFKTQNSEQLFNRNNNQSFGNQIDISDDDLPF